MLFLFFNEHLLLSSAVLVLIIQLFGFIFAYKFKTDKLTDLSYGLTFVVLSIMCYASIIRLQSQLKLIYILIIIWSFRLSLYRFIRILKMGKDPRFDDLRNNFRALLTFWGLQAFTIWVMILPFTVSNSTGLYTRNWGFFENFGFFIWLAGFSIETVADQQKFIFKSESRNKNKWIETGLWYYSQHPNYFGEIFLWWGLFIMTIPIIYGWYWLLMISPIVITVLITKISGIPFLQKSANKKYKDNPDYRRYKWRTNILIPIRPRNRSKH